MTTADAQDADQKATDYKNALAPVIEALRAGNQPTKAHRDALKAAWDALVMAGDKLV